MAGGIYFWNTCATQQLVTPGAVGANSTISVSVTLPGLLLTDIVIFAGKPTYTAGIDVGWIGKPSAVNTATLVLQNSTAGSVTPPAEQYQFIIYRAENAPGSADGLSNGAVIFK